MKEVVAERYGKPGDAKRRGAGSTRTQKKRQKFINSIEQAAGKLEIARASFGCHMRPASH
jgi:hypothetical protein